MFSCTFLDKEFLNMSNHDNEDFFFLSVTNKEGSGAANFGDDATS